MKIMRYGILIVMLVLSTPLIAQICPEQVICRDRNIESCFPLGSAPIPLCNARQKHYCWQMIQLPYGTPSRVNSYDRPPLNGMCYYYNDCGYYSVILSYQGGRLFGL